MKLTRGNRGRLSMTFVLVFAVQILVSSLCISTSAQAMESISQEHCHQGMSEISTQVQPEQIPATTCSHCASPDDIALFVNDLDVSSPHLILAFVVMETISIHSEAGLPNFIERTRTPPRSSTTLYTTTQRIRI